MARGRRRFFRRRPKHEEHSLQPESEDSETTEVKPEKPLKRIKRAPDSLGSRQRALNTKVNDAFANHVDFEGAKTASEATELDKLFKIDLAAKYKHVEYIIDVLKSADSLYTARALKKCEWLFQDEYSHIMNPDYLQENIFPVISSRMKRKILKAAARNVTNPDRAAEFYNCCMKEKMTNTALTCLLYTSETFKVNILQNRGPVSDLNKKDDRFIRFLVGQSFEVLKAYLDFLYPINWKVSLTARKFKHLYYSVSNEKYLDIAEKYIGTWYKYETDKLDEKLSESIIKNHKERVLSNLKFYIYTLDTGVLVKNGTMDDAKIYIPAVLPATGNEFWALHHYSIYRPLFKLIPEDKTYEFFKNFFAEHYPDTEFEMHLRFYEQKFYNFLTAEERQEWALRHLQSQKQILGVGNDYIWYKFVKFELAFPKIKELVSITKKAETRNDMVNVLVEVASDNRDLESLFTYYHKRHLNELRKYKEIFLNKVISKHNVFKFDKRCWTAFYDVLLTMDLYNTADTNEKKDYESTNKTYKNITVLYHIVNEEAFPEDLMKFFLDEFNVDCIDEYLDKIGEEHFQKLHDYFFDVYFERIIEFKAQPHSNIVNERTRRYFNNMTTSMATFHEGEDSDDETTENVCKKTRYINTSLSDKQLLRDLKKDKEIVIQKIDEVKEEYESCSFKLNNFLKKIKIYFSDDVRKVYLGMFEDLVEENKDLRPVMSGVYGIFGLGDETIKTDFINKHIPIGGKIDRKKENIGQLRTQKAICRYACISRPPLPLSNMVMYMKGSYAKYCLHVFNTYLAILPLPMCLEFVHLVIDAPISIQKHAIRLAFQCFSVENLIKVMTDIWENTKNVSMRSVIYKAIFKKVIETKTPGLFEILLKITSSLHQNDENELFDMIVSDELSDDFLMDYIEAAWEAVSLFDDVQPNIKRKKDVIRFIQNKLHHLRKDFVLTIIQQHLDMMIKQNDLKMTYAEDDISEILKEKWVLTARYIMHYNRSENSQDEYVEMCQYIAKHCVDNWNEIIDDEFVYQKLLKDYLSYLKNASYKHNTKNVDDSILIFENLLSLIKPTLAYQDTYQLTWDLELAIMSRKVVKNNKHNNKMDKYDLIIKACKELSKELGNLVSRYVANRTYVITYSSKVKDMIKTYAENIIHIFFQIMNDVDNETEDDDYDEGDCIGGVLITLASGLIEFELHETFLLAVQLLPTEYENNDDFIFVFDKLKLFNHPEVQFALYQKFRKLCNETNSVKYTKSMYDTICNII